MVHRYCSVGNERRRWSGDALSVSAVPVAWPARVFRRRRRGFERLGAPNLLDARAARTCYLARPVHRSGDRHSDGGSVSLDHGAPARAARVAT